MCFPGTKVLPATPLLPSRSRGRTGRGSRASAPDPDPPSQKAVADDQHLDLGAHEAAERVLRRADDRLAAHVEAGIDQHRAAGLRLERARSARG